MVETDPRLLSAEELAEIRGRAMVLPEDAELKERGSRGEDGPSCWVIECQYGPIIETYGYSLADQEIAESIGAMRDDRMDLLSHIDAQAERIAAMEAERGELLSILREITAIPLTYGASGYGMDVHLSFDLTDRIMAALRR